MTEQTRPAPPVIPATEPRHYYEFDCGNCGDRITALIPCVRAEAAQGAAPTPVARCVCGDPWPCDLHADPSMLPGAAPRAEGLDAPTLDDLLDEHELAAALHAEFWTEDKPHIVDPPEGDDCAICYDTADRIAGRLSRPSDDPEETDGR